MLGRSATRRTRAKTGTPAGRSRRARRRWCRVRVETDTGAYVGSLELGEVGLRELVDAERAYMGLWNAEHEAAQGVVEFLALHKGAICSVTVVGEEPRAPGRPQEA